METHALASPERRWRPSVIVTQTSVSAKVGGARARGAEACGRDGGSPPCAKRAQIGLLSFPARTRVRTAPQGLPRGHPGRQGTRGCRLPPRLRAGVRVYQQCAQPCALRGCAARVALTRAAMPPGGGSLWTDKDRTGCPTQPPRASAKPKRVGKKTPELWL